MAPHQGRASCGQGKALRAGTGFGSKSESFISQMSILNQSADINVLYFSARRLPRATDCPCDKSHLRVDEEGVRHEISPKSVFEKDATLKK